MDISTILQQVHTGELTVSDAKAMLSDRGFNDFGFVNIDTSREERTGIPEIIYGGGKTVDQVREIVKRLADNRRDILVTRCTSEMYTAVKEVVPDAIYHPLARTIHYRFNPKEETRSYICVVTAGTSDIPIAEEAVVTATFLGNKVVSVYDVGVAGIHRLFDKIELIRNARVIIVVAGMEGALASVVGGLAAKPVIAVPTSIGYGANFGGLSALLSMLNSCASGVSVVNIDNGFGAACQASLINKL